jgi:putative solute:sodium symporter small subunit
MSDEIRSAVTGKDGALDVRDPRVAAAITRYWRRNVRIMSVLLAFWAAAGLGCGVLFADWLNRFQLGGFPLGFWFAQQGSILVFVILILIYGLALNRLDADHHRELERICAERDTESRSAAER